MQHPIQSISGIMSLAAADADADGDNDILIGTEKYIASIKNLDGEGNFEGGHTIIANNLEFWLIQLADTDLDGDKDLICDSGILDIIENTFHESGIIKKKEIFTNFITDFKISDLNSDGNEDILACHHSYSEVFWLENLEGSWNLSANKTVYEALKWPAVVIPGDIDGDEDLDIIVAGSGEENSFEFGPSNILWFENTDGMGSFGDKNGITTESQDTKSLITADMDGDGDLDVVSASWEPIEQVAWYENLDGNGNFGEQSTIHLVANALSLNATDMDKDGDMDLIFTKDYPDQIVWCENLDGSGNFGEMKVIATHDQEYGLSIFASAVDLDGDEDMDIVASFMDNILWYENIDGENNFIEHTVTSDDRRRRYSFIINDFDQDGRSDIIAYSDYDYSLAWYKNLSEAPSDMHTDLIEAVDKYSLNQNYPNPFNSSTRINYNISEASMVKLKIYDLLGNEIETIVKQYQKADSYSIVFNGDKFSSGLYFYTLTVDNKYSNTKKMLLIR
jgi:hypothetical protein